MRERESGRKGGLRGSCFSGCAEECRFWGSVSYRRGHFLPSCPQPPEHSVCLAQVGSTRALPCPPAGLLLWPWRCEPQRPSGLSHGVWALLSLVGWHFYIHNVRVKRSTIKERHSPGTFPRLWGKSIRAQPLLAPGESSPGASAPGPRAEARWVGMGEWLGVVQGCQAHQLQRAGQSRALLRQRLAGQSG